MKHLVTCIFVLFGIIINAQTGRVDGTVMDSKTGETLPGATILVEGTNKVGSADFDGKFSIANVTPGKVVLVVSYISYTTKKIAGVEVKAGDATNVNILLDPSALNDFPPSDDTVAYVSIT